MVKGAGWALGCSVYAEDSFLPPLENCPNQTVNLSDFSFLWANTYTHLFGSLPGYLTPFTGGGGFSLKPEFPDLATTPTWLLGF